MLRLILPQIKLLCKIRSQNGIALRYLQNMIAYNQFFGFLSSQNIIILLHQFGNSSNSRPGKEALSRPMEFYFRTEQEKLHSLFVRESFAEIHIRQTRTAGECIRFHFRQGFRDLQRKETRAIPESLCLNSAYTLRNFKPFTALRAEEGTGCNHRVLFQGSAALNRAGHRLGNFMRKDFVLGAVFSAVYRNKRNRLIQFAVFLSLFNRLCSLLIDFFGKIGSRRSNLMILFRFRLRSIRRHRSRCSLLFLPFGNLCDRLLNFRNHADFFL